MQLFVIRHATAVLREARTPDAIRPLTPKGRRRWKRAVEGLEALGVTFDRLYHSPWLRAVETADALADLVEGETVVTKELAQRPAPALLAQLEGERVALVGHQPWLGELIGLLAFGDPRAGARLILKKGSVVWLDGQPRAGKMTIRAVLPPRVLRALAGSWRRRTTSSSGLIPASRRSAQRARASSASIEKRQRKEHAGRGARRQVPTEGLRDSLRGRDRPGR